MTTPKPATPRGFHPKAIIRDIPPGSNDPEIIPDGCVYHVAVSEALSLFDFFSHDGGIESHFYIRRDGTFEQYRSIFFEADAQFAGNSFGSPRKGFISFETQGMGTGEWTDAQVATMKMLTLWVHAQSKKNFELRVCPAWDESGIGYHSMFAEWNTDHHSCPGPDRVVQFHKVFVPWIAAAAAAAAEPVALTKPVPRRHVFHVKHGQPYHLEDSVRGVRLAVAKKYGWIDLDCHVTSDGVLVITHWPEPMIHDGFVDPEGKIPPHSKIEDLTWAQVARLRTKVDGYRINRADRLVPYAISLGLHVELELKTTKIGAQELTYLRQHLDKPSWVQVKALPDFYTALKGAHVAGFDTIILGRGASIPTSAQPWLTYRRGPVTWVGRRVKAAA